MDKAKWHCKLQSLVCILIVALIHLWGCGESGSGSGSTTFAPDEGSESGVTIHAPNGGEIIASGSSYTIDWDPPPEATYSNLQYSLNKGIIWTTIAKSITGASYDWQVPTLTKNNRECLVKVTAYNSSGKKLATDKSDRPFFITIDNINSIIRFEDVSQFAGFSYAHQSWGASWADFNNDGKPDLWTSNHFAPDTWYLNQGDGTFKDVTSEIVTVEELEGDLKPNLTGCLNPDKCGNDTHGAAFADFDNDGDQDLVVLSGAGPRREFFPDRQWDRNQFLINDGGKFKDYENAQDFVDRMHHGRTPLWVDFDNDGLLDIVVIAKPPSSPDRGLSTIFRQTAYGFEDMGPGANFGPFEDYQVPYALLADLAVEDTLQLVVKNKALIVYDLSLFPLVDITSDLFQDQSEDSTWVDTDVVTADFNGDLLTDIYRTRFGKPDILLINTGQGFIDKSEESGINNVENPGKNVVAGDFDNDMDIDIYIVASGEAKNRPNLLYENQGNGTFLAVPNAGGAAGPSLLGRGDAVTTADYNGDGFLDLFVTNGDWGLVGFRNTEGPYQLFCNLGNENHWIEIDLEGTISNRNGIGAKVLVSAGGITQLREQSGGMHNKAQNHMRLHFGLGNITVVDTIIVKWPSGLEQTLVNESVDQILKIVEGSN